MEDIILNWFIIIIVGIILARINNKFDDIKRDFSNPFFSLAIFCIILLSIWGLEPSQPQSVKTATINSLLAFMVAYAAYREMYISIFIIIWVWYYLQNS